MTKLFAKWASWENFSEQHLDVLRELLSYDALCWRSNNIVKRNGILTWELAPSPFHWSRQVEWPWAILEGNPQSTDTILEVGPGWGVFQYALAKRCKELYTLDASEDACNQVQLMRKKYGISPNLHQTLGDARRLPYESNKFDQVYCISTIEHIDPEMDVAVSECVRVLKPGGKLILTMDVNVGGQSKVDDHHLDATGASKILNSLGITSIDNTETVLADVAGATIGVVLVYFEKSVFA